MQILDKSGIEKKINRLALEIIEGNFHDAKIFLLGINKNGLHFAQLVHESILKTRSKGIALGSISINAKNPLEDEIVCSVSDDDLRGQNIIILDDVANTGRTLLYACKPILGALPNRLETAVLINRKHKSFPINVNYKGMELATTFKNNIRIDFETKSAFLE